jgi:hypothetical protein
MDIESFNLGLLKRAEELDLTSAMKEHLLKLASIFNTEDALRDLSAPHDLDSEVGNFVNHNLLHGLPYAGIGAGAGALAGHHFSKDKKDRLKNTLIGAGLGAVIGEGGGIVNNMANLAINDRNLALDDQEALLNKTQPQAKWDWDFSDIIPSRKAYAEQDPLHEIYVRQFKDIAKTPWWEYYLPTAPPPE